MKLRGETNCLLLMRGSVVSRHAHHERSCPTAIKEVLRDARTASLICRSEPSIEIRSKVNVGTIVGAWSEDTCDADADVWLCVCGSLASKVHKEGERLQFPMTAVFTTSVRRVF
jgi:hypothetical protein